MERVKIGGGSCNFLMVRLRLGLLYDKLEGLMEHFSSVQQLEHLCLAYTECPRRNGQNFGREFLMLNYTDITQNTYIQS